MGLLSIAEDLHRHQIISANSLDQIRKSISRKSIENEKGLFDAMVVLAFDELPENSKAVYSADSPGFYYAMPALTTHVEVPKKYKAIISGIYKMGIIDNEGKKLFDDFLDTPSDSIDHLAIMEAFNYRFLQMIADHIKE